MTVHNIVCVCCPCGCDMEVTVDESGQISSIHGNECARGLNHAADEVVAPTRVLTQCLCVPGALEPLSVKTATAIPKALMMKAAAEVDAAASSIVLPVHAGDIVIDNLCATGVPVIATKSIG